MRALQRSIPFVLGAVALAAVVTALIVSGSPRRARLERYDQQRLSDLQAIDQAIANHARLKLQAGSGDPVLPSSLEALSQARVGDIYRDDPVTGEPYAYRVTGDDAYELCAVFATRNRSGPAVQVPYSIGEWLHDAGRTCFSRTIDRSLLLQEPYAEPFIKYPVVAPPEPLPQ